MMTEVPSEILGALEHPDEALRSVFDAFGADAHAFLAERVHTLHEWGVESPADYVRHHLWEAHRLNTFDVGTVDGRGRRAADLTDDAALQRLLLRPQRPVQPERWTLPFNTLAQDHFLDRCAWADVDALQTALQSDPTLVHARTKWGMSTVYQVGAFGSDEAAPNRAATRLLVDAGAPAFGGLYGAAWWGGGDVVHTLLELGVHPEEPRTGRSALHMACVASRHNEMGKPADWLPLAEALIEAGARVSWPDDFAWMPWAMARGPVRALVERHGAVQSERMPGLDTWMNAARKADAAVLRSADPSWVRLRDRDTACTAALTLAYDGHLDLAAEVARRDPFGPGLDDAAALGLVDALPEAAERAGLLSPRSSGNALPGAPLHHAAWFGQLDVARWLIERGYSPGALHGADIGGRHRGPEAIRDTTPLHLAVERGHRALVEHFVAVMDGHRGR